MGVASYALPAFCRFTLSFNASDTKALSDQM